MESHWLKRTSWGCVYVVQMEGHPWLKIGYTTRSGEQGMRERLSQMQNGCPLPLMLLKAYHCEAPERIEDRIHKLLALHRRRGAWFETTLEDVDQAFTFAMAPGDDFWISEEQRVALEARRQKLAKAAEFTLERAIEHFKQVRQREACKWTFWQRLCRYFESYVRHV
jgi:Meiotically up-regulated gene 113